MTSSNACSGVLGWIASLFGSSTPTYVGDGQPAASCGGGWSLFGNAPAYVVAPAEPAPVPVPTAGVQPPSCPPDASDGAEDGVMRPVAIIIRRESPEVVTE